MFHVKQSKGGNIMLGKKDVQNVPLETPEQKKKKDNGETRYLRVKLPLSLHKEIRKRAIDADMNVADFVADVLSKTFNLS